ncbi:heavy metal translocating P-type ATPase [Biostraticola tofi]|uniref:Cd2+/Zn2+-exporting ATPase n=1 Tax=Biostraticola tofi TaxID=466109 RepID=A0A4R3YW30_9GAMM|nr:heavy metal translocating P-type ATPase [Biostraticola tofi]TCV96696.1 Cd2+/Zn2+-exporting ATPase [Biostraticola tofi]
MADKADKHDLKGKAQFKRCSANPNPLRQACADHAHTGQHTHAAKHIHAAEHIHAGGQAAAGCHADDSEAKSAGGCCSVAPVSWVKLAAAQAVDDGIRTPVRIMQMDCPTEEGMIRKKLGTMAVVTGLEFNLMQRILTITHAPGSLDSILAAIRTLGFEPEVPDASGHIPDTPQSDKARWPLVLAAFAAVASEAAHWLGATEWLSAGLALLAIIACGLSTYKKGWLAIRNGNLNINALMSIAVTGAIALGQWPEAAMVMVLFTLAELIEAKSLDRARNAISGLMKLAPEQAQVKQDDGTWQEVNVNAVAIGSLVRVRPGERVALDGDITEGSSAINQAPITGESLPVDKAVGDSVFAGTINQSGSFEYRVTAAAGSSTLARIIHAVEQAQSVKAPTQRFVDRFARIYTPLVFAAALAVAILPPLLMGGEWQPWIYKALVMLVIACPCALVISTPVTIVSGLTAAARVGILIKGGIYLEQGRKLAWLALDKTGTLTHGKPALTDAESMKGIQEVTARRLAFSLASRSDHPVSRAIVAAADHRDIEPWAVTAFSAIPGQGIQGLINGKLYRLGNQRMLSAAFRGPATLALRINQLEQQGKTVIILAGEAGEAGEAGVLMLFAVADTVRESSRQAIDQMHRLGISTVMLTGDNSHTAQAIAQQVGIDKAMGNLLPEDKMAEVAGFSRQGLVGMVGDGINDAPALARADIGFAMGAMGTDTAIETADVALMDDDLRKIPLFVNLSRRTHQILIENIVLALGIKVVFLAATLAGMGTLWMAVFADVGASLLVVANGLRLLRNRKPTI